MKAWGPEIITVELLQEKRNVPVVCWLESKRKGKKSYSNKNDS